MPATLPWPKMPGAGDQPVAYAVALAVLRGQEAHQRLAVVRRRVVVLIRTSRGRC